jgi:hypothetical protein
MNNEIESLSSQEDQNGGEVSLRQERDRMVEQELERLAQVREQTRLAEERAQARLESARTMQRVTGKSRHNLKWFMPYVTDRILDAIRSGATQALAAQYAGISPDTLRKWLKEGEEAPEGDPLNDFYVEFHKARAVKAKITLDRIQEIGDNINSWQAHAWVLERSFPEQFGRGIFGNAPGETTEIKHVIEIKRDDSSALPAPTEGPGTTRYQLSGPDDAPEPGEDQTADDFPVIEPTD